MTKAEVEGVYVNLTGVPEECFLPDKEAKEVTQNPGDRVLSLPVYGMFSSHGKEGKPSSVEQAGNRYLLNLVLSKEGEKYRLSDIRYSHSPADKSVIFEPRLSENTDPYVRNEPEPYWHFETKRSIRRIDPGDYTVDELLGAFEASHEKKPVLKYVPPRHDQKAEQKKPDHFVGDIYRNKFVGRDIDGVPHQYYTIEFPLTPETQASVQKQLNDFKLAEGEDYTRRMSKSSGDTFILSTPEACEKFHRAMGHAMPDSLRKRYQPVPVPPRNKDSGRG